MNKRIKTQLLCWAIPTAACFGASPSQSDGTAGTAAEAESDSTVFHTLLAGIEISANRASGNTPVAYSVVRKADIEKRNTGRDLPYLVGMTPSVTVTSDAGAGVGYTALRVRGTDPSRINVMANGVPINDAESHNVYWVNMPDLTASARDIQIQRGAGTSVNGAGAFGASVNMVTDMPSQVASGRVDLAYGMYNTHKESLSLSTGRIGGHWTLDARLSNIGSEGYIDRASSKLWSYWGQLGWSGGRTSLRMLAFGGKEETYMAWDYATKEEIREFGRRYNPCGKYTDSEGKTAYYPDQKDRFAQHHLQLHFTQGISEDWNLTATLFYTKGKGHYEQLKTKRKLVEYGLEPFETADGTLVTKSDLVRLKYNDNDFGGLNAAANWRRGSADVTVGLSASFFRGNHFGEVAWVRNYVGPVNPLQSYYSNTGRKADGNAFARATWEVTDGLSLFADMQWRLIRYTIHGVSDNYDYAAGTGAPLDVHCHWNFLNPKAGVNWTDHTTTRPSCRGARRTASRHATTSPTATRHARRGPNASLTMKRAIPTFTPSSRPASTSIGWIIRTSLC